LPPGKLVMVQDTTAGSKLPSAMVSSGFYSWFYPLRFLSIHSKEFRQERR